MGGSRRRRGGSGPSGPSSQVRVEHFRLLRTFGKSELQRRANEKQREEFWKMVCQSAPGLPFIPHTIVVEEWRKFISGNAENSGIAINGDIDANYVSVGVTFHRKFVAAHTTQTRPLIKRLLSIYMRGFDTKADFLDSLETLCKEVVDQSEKPKTKRPSRD